MEIDSIDFLDLVVSSLALITATVSVLSVMYQTRKGWYLSLVPQQRLVWADNLRVAVFDFISMYYEGKDLRSARAKILLYLNPKNEEHIKFIQILDKICCNKAPQKEKYIDQLINKTQELLRKNWWTVKSESGVTLFEESRRDAQVNRRRAYHEKKSKKYTY